VGKLIAAYAITIFVELNDRTAPVDMGSDQTEYQTDKGLCFKKGGFSALKRCFLAQKEHSKQRMPGS